MPGAHPAAGAALAAKNAAARVLLDAAAPLLDLALAPIMSEPLKMPNGRTF